MNGDPNIPKPRPSDENMVRAEQRRREVAEESAARYREFAESVRRTTQPEMDRALKHA